MKVLQLLMPAALLALAWCQDAGSDEGMEVGNSRVFAVLSATFDQLVNYTLHEASGGATGSLPDCTILAGISFLIDTIEFSLKDEIEEMITQLQTVEPCPTEAENSIGDRKKRSLEEGEKLESHGTPVLHRYRRQTAMPDDGIFELPCEASCDSTGFRCCISVFVGTSFNFASTRLLSTCLAASVQSCQVAYPSADFSSITDFGDDISDAFSTCEIDQKCSQEQMLAVYELFLGGHDGREYCTTYNFDGCLSTALGYCHDIGVGAIGLAYIQQPCLHYLLSGTSGNLVPAGYELPKSTSVLNCGVKFMDDLRAGDDLEEFCMNFKEHSDCIDEAVADFPAEVSEIFKDVMEPTLDNIEDVICRDDCNWYKFFTLVHSAYEQFLSDGDLCRVLTETKTALTEYQECSDSILGTMATTFIDVFTARESTCDTVPIAASTDTCQLSLLSGSVQDVANKLLGDILQNPSYFVNEDVCSGALSEAYFPQAVYLTLLQCSQEQRDSVAFLSFDVRDQISVNICPVCDTNIVQACTEDVSGIYSGGEDLLDPSALQCLGVVKDVNSCLETLTQTCENNLGIVVTAFHGVTSFQRSVCVATDQAEVDDLTVSPCIKDSLDTCVNAFGVTLSGFLNGGDIQTSQICR